MKVLTLKQPWASLIVNGYKEYEFRTWKTNYRGEFLIHAGLGVDKEAMKRLEYLNLDYPKGCIIGKATLTDCLFVDDKLKEELKRKDKLVYQGTINSKDKEYAFKLENVSKVKPIFTKGKLSFWEYCEDDIKVL